MQKCSILFALFIFLFSLFTGNVHAQLFPHDSPKANITQKVGFNEISISYSRPRVRGREIWDVLVPYGEVWRTGANYPTMISFETETSIESNSLPAGKYALYSIPNKSEWIIIFSKNTELWGAFGYEADDDALRVSVNPENTNWTESFTIEFSNVTTNSANLNLRWANINVPIKIEVNTYKEFMSNTQNELKKNEEQDWRFYWQAAKHLLELKRDLDLAEDWIRRSTKLEKNWMNLWTRAELSAFNENFEEAVKVGKETFEICKENTPYCAYVKVYEKQIIQWSLKK